MVYLIPLYLNTLVNEEKLSGEYIVNLLNGNFWYLLSIPIIVMAIYLVYYKCKKENLSEIISKEKNKILLFLNIYFWGVVSMYSVYPKNNIYFTVFFYSAIFFLLLLALKNIKIPIIFISILILVQNMDSILITAKYIFFWPNYVVIFLLKPFPKYALVISVFFVPIFVLLYFEILIRNLGRSKLRFSKIIQKL